MFGFVEAQLRTPVNLVDLFETYQGRGSEKKEGDDGDDLQYKQHPYYRAERKNLQL